MDQTRPQNATVLLPNKRVTGTSALMMDGTERELSCVESSQWAKECPFGQQKQTFEAINCRTYAQIAAPSKTIAVSTDWDGNSVWQTDTICLARGWLKPVTIRCSVWFCLAFWLKYEEYIDPIAWQTTKSGVQSKTTFPNMTRKRPLVAPFAGAKQVLLLRVSNPNTTRRRPRTTVLLTESWAENREPSPIQTQKKVVGVIESSITCHGVN